MDVSWIPEAVGRPAHGCVPVPGSKAVAQRALVVGALAHGVTRIEGAPASDDLAVLRRALTDLGVRLEEQGNVLSVHGVGGRLPAGPRTLDVGANGTALRFITALATLRAGSFLSPSRSIETGAEVTGAGAPSTDWVDLAHVAAGAVRIAGAAHRPVAPLVTALRSLGAHVRLPEGGSGPPVEVETGPPAGGSVVLNGVVSSQFASALLLIGPWLALGLTLELQGTVVSASYLDVTVEVLRRFGVTIVCKGGTRFNVPGGQRPRAATLTVPPDASTAAFVLAAAAVTGGRVDVPGALTGFAQGDACCADLLERMGCRVERQVEFTSVAGPARCGIDVDLCSTPDLVPPLAAVAALVPGATTVMRGVAHLVHKESNRLAVLAEGLRRLGVEVEYGADFLRVTGKDAARLRGQVLDPGGDHRMAMAFLLLALRVPGVEVADVACIAKSDPGFTERLRRLVLPG